MQNRQGFTKRHPFLFGLLIVATVMVLVIGAMAVFSFWLPSRAGSGFAMGGEKVGVVHVRGVIAESRQTNEWIARLRKDGSVKGVLVRINSPGGGVAPSQEIFQALKLLAAKKPVVISMGSVAASGGYYIACAGQTIVANPGSLTGSIGVKAQLMSMQDLMEKIGIKEQTITSGKLKNAGTPFRPLTQEERQYFQALVNDLHEQFVEDVAQSRKMDLETVRTLADGRAMTGRQAYEAGLVDAMGGFEDALTMLKKAAGIKKEPQLVEGPAEEKGLLGLLFSELNTAVREKNWGPRWEFLYE